MAHTKHALLWLLGPLLPTDQVTQQMHAAFEPPTTVLLYHNSKGMCIQDQLTCAMRSPSTKPTMLVHALVNSGRLLRALL